MLCATLKSASPLSHCRVVARQQTTSRQPRLLLLTAIRHTPVVMVSAVTARKLYVDVWCHVLEPCNSKLVTDCVLEYNTSCEESGYDEQVWHDVVCACSPQCSPAAPQMCSYAGCELHSCLPPTPLVGGCMDADNQFAEELIASLAVPLCGRVYIPCQ